MALRRFLYQSVFAVPPAKKPPPVFSTWELPVVRVTAIAVLAQFSAFPYGNPPPQSPVFAASTAFFTPFDVPARPCVVQADFSAFPFKPPAAVVVVAPPPPFTAFDAPIQRQFVSADFSAFPRTVTATQPVFTAFDVPAQRRVVSADFSAFQSAVTFAVPPVFYTFDVPAKQRIGDLDFSQHIFRLATPAPVFVAPAFASFDVLPRPTVRADLNFALAPPTTRPYDVLAPPDPYPYPLESADKWKRRAALEVRLQRLYAARHKRNYEEILATVRHAVYGEPKTEKPDDLKPKPIVKAKFVQPQVARPIQLAQGSHFARAMDEFAQRGFDVADEEDIETLLMVES